MLGLQYMYKTGYDPEAFVDFFEKIESLEKKKPGTMAKVFSTHPPTDDRIVAAQKNIQDYAEGAAGVRGHHVGVQRREGPPGDAAQSPQDRTARIRTARSCAERRDRARRPTADRRPAAATTIVRR